MTIRDGTSRPTLLDVLRRQIALCEQQRLHALEEENWLLAFDGLIQSLSWRAKRLALELGFLASSFPGSDDRIEDLCLIRRECLAAMQEETPSLDKADRYHKAEAVADILTSIIDTLEVMIRPTGEPGHYVYALVHQAVEIGRAEVGLDFAETGFWDEVARWKAQRGGRPQGTVAKWSIEALPVIQSWIAAEPQISTEKLVAKLASWLAAYGRSHPDFKAPDRASLRKTLDRMHDKGRLQLPTRIKVGQ